jgi:DNA transformation protein
LPARLFDEPEELSEWARAALAAAQRAGLQKRARSRKAAKAGRKGNASAIKLAAKKKSKKGAAKVRVTKKKVV